MKYLYLVLILIILAACSKNEVPGTFTEGLKKIEKRFIADKRLAIFDVHAEYEDGIWHIKGETTSASAIDPINELALQVFGLRSTAMEVVVLPVDDLRHIAAGVVKVSVANLRRHPKHAAEMVDQAILGQRLKILKKKSYWYLVQTTYGYLGWVTNGSLALLDQQQLENWEQAEKVEVIANYAQIYSKANRNSDPVGDAVLGSILIKGRGAGAWQEVILPDSVQGFIAKTAVSNIDPQHQPVSNDPASYVKTARRLLGLPYLWGGNSVKGLDCSGFTQTVYRENGVQLPRDANMQVALGEEIIPDATFSNVQEGDLIFFGPEGRITHVAMSLGGAQFIHSSGNVHINSLLPTDENYNDYRRRTLRHIRRIINTSSN